MYHVTFPPQSNRASWIFVGLITDLNDNPIDISSCTMVFQISPKRPGGDFYSNQYHDTYSGAGLTASSANGKLTVIDLGKFQWFFTLQDMQSLCAGTYDTGLTLTNNDGTQTVQLSVGPLPITDGVVPSI
jgi:hypothetical protein